MRARIKNYFTSMMDMEKTFEERHMVFLSLLADIALLITLIVDLIIKEHPVECMMLLVMIFVVPLGTAASIRAGHQELGAKLQSLFMIFIVLPISFFFGGGARGGGVFWITLGYVLIGGALSGWWRALMMTLLSVMTVGEFFIWFVHPEYVVPHTDPVFCVDALVSAILNGLVVYGVVRFQKIMLRAESKHAKEEALRAEELNRSQNRFFSSMSHEIRTPINAILGLNEIILRQEDASDEIRKDARNIQGSGKMLLSLVNDILDFSKIEAGKMDIVPVNYNIGAMLSEIVNMVWLRAEEKGLQFNVSVDPTIPTELFGDEVRIKQILINLLNNAIKYTKEGTVNLYIECGERLEEQALLVFSVSDTGMGIKPESLPYLFDAFQRVDEEKNRKIEGTGLGLSIVKQLVELMDGNISVDSVYLQGSTFTVTLWQKISDSKDIGAITIANFGTAETHGRESAFRAPDAHILIVDDNEVNLEVEKKLIQPTEMDIDIVLSGEDALEKCLQTRYDAILMDHLMPGMDGVECLIQIRRQIGGLNNHTPIVVLTANAAGENKELYDHAGFDGHLLKPVSGVQLEEMLLKVLPPEKIFLKNTELVGRELNTAKGYSKKIPVLITTSSMCDLPSKVTQSLLLDMIPFMIKTDGGVFEDAVEVSADELIHYMERPGTHLDSEPPSEEEFESFFAEEVKKAHQVIHIALTTSMSKEYERASAAAKTFENVTVINSECLSSALGLLVLLACRLAAINEPPEKIVTELEAAKKLIHCSFVIGSLEFMWRRGFISARTHLIMKNLEMHPALRIKNNRFGVGKIWRGSIRECYERYIAYALPKNANPDTDVLFITYADMSEEDLNWIESEVRKRYAFKRIIFQKATAAIALNCGPGTFGLLYMKKSEHTGHLDTLLEMAMESTKHSQVRYEATTREEQKTTGAPAGEKSSQDRMPFKPEEKPARETDKTAKNAWYDELPGIDGEVAIHNSGSEESLRTVLQIFYDSIGKKTEELDGYYQAGDWENYTIKIHALKSSAKLIGAVTLSEEAQSLESAGKTGEIDYIKQHHAQTMEQYAQYETYLQSICGSAQDGDDDRPLADPEMIKSAYAAMKTAAENMDISVIESVLEELKAYRIAEPEEARFAKIKECYEMFDYDGIVSAIEQ
ncbi:MAG: DegV family EDD domain-containing protein [Lachnospiraceae bacterium]|nr:DegV family EDD domain-containing protein [Lachnospiraceae bacterium]